VSSVANSPSVGARARSANPRGQGDRLRLDLLRAAKAFVETYGARQLTLRGLARQVGVSAPSVYLHFPNLDHLLAALVVQGFEDLTAATSRCPGYRRPRRRVARTLPCVLSIRT